MKLRPLPEKVRRLLDSHGAPPRLVAHLELVHDVAHHLAEKVQDTFPELKFDCEAVLIGAASHDIGKAIHRNELTGKGSDHEIAGRDLLLKSGFPEHQARFAYTHGGPHREPNPTLEDLLVRTSDSVWKGSRHHDSEMELVRKIAGILKQPEWQVYSGIDDLLTDLAADADERLLYQSSHPA